MRPGTDGAGVTCVLPHVEEVVEVVEAVVETLPFVYEFEPAAGFLQH